MSGERGGSFIPSGPGPRPEGRSSTGPGKLASLPGPTAGGALPEDEPDPVTKRLLSAWALAQRRAVEATRLDLWSSIADRIRRDA